MQPWQSCTFTWYGQCSNDVNIVGGHKVSSDSGGISLVVNTVI